MLNIPATAGLLKTDRRRLRQSQFPIQFSTGQQPRVGDDPRPVELQPQPLIELEL